MVGRTYRSTETALMAKNLSTFAIAQMLHVDPGSVANWIDQGLLQAHRTPGGHRRVAVEDLIKFLRDHKMPIPAELATGPKRILVIDDQVAITQLIARAVKAAHPDCQVIEAHDGFHAGAQVATLKPDIVILDLQMPGLDAFDVCRLIKSDESAKPAEIIAMTTHASDENVRRIKECGAQVCLTKPLDMDQLLKEIEAML